MLCTQVPQRIQLLSCHLIPSDKSLRVAHYESVCGLHVVDDDKSGDSSLLWSRSGLGEGLRAVLIDSAEVDLTGSVPYDYYFAVSEKSGCGALSRQLTVTNAAILCANCPKHSLSIPAYRLHIPSKH
jgi:hypothetical protein